MKKFAFIDPATGEILNIRMPYVVPEFWTDNAVIEDKIVKELDSSINNAEWIHGKYWSGTEWLVKPVRPSDNHKWTSEGWQEVINVEDTWDKARGHRDRLLYSCDWTQTLDSPLSDSKKEEWRVYRQLLRDITTTQSSAQRFADIVWPTEPT
jgi:hypothetical protein